MIGRNPLRVAKQHGHSVTTTFRVYSAGAEGALQADVQAIKRAMKRSPVPPVVYAPRSPDRRDADPGGEPIYSS